MTSFTFQPIGVIHSPYSAISRPPRQGRLAPDVSAQIEIFEEFSEGLEGIEDFECIYVLFVFDRSHGWSANVTPPGAPKSRGVFATRSPRRPCPIGLTPVRLEKREGRFLHIKGIDAFDQTPVLDIKPYIGSIDAFPDAGRKAEKDLGLK
ncbi:MAG: tRNA (N6-threonylcarbamoyladenosine(37)-N6)-methyltransferase TrmO [Candidatus Omnitrophica bacterium]|nr:tRNA (N6-threonylcarbamoyladenosine(37)-N6)-methyltransferase TrmO [Candidatus Omnitrophota bacterium]